MQIGCHPHAKHQAFISWFKEPIPELSYRAYCDSLFAVPYNSK